MPGKKILIIDTIHSAFEDVLSQHGFECIDGTKWNKEYILRHADMYDGFAIRSRFRIDEEVFRAAKQLKFIARSGAGMENIDVPAAGRAGVVLINAPEGNRDAVAEHAIAMLLCLFNRVAISDKEIRNGIWKRSENRGIELHGKTVAIIGFGYMGSAFAERLTGFGVRIIAYDKYIKIDSEKYPFVEQVQLNEIFQSADVVSLHVPLTGETHFMVDRQFINNFSKSIYIINTARGQVVKTNAVVEGLRNRKIKGACLDVFEHESTSFEQLSNDDLPEDWKYLIKSEDVILTPHVAGWTHESYRKLSEVMAQKILQLYNLK
jgi:D-3-phosphoglycerate dehydrogenase / 2-oxoglutarate reductase